MGLLFCDGFDKYAADTDFSKRGWAVGNLANSNYNSAGGRFGGGAAEITNTNMSIGIAGMPSRVLFAMSLKMSALPGSDRFLVNFASSTGGSTNAAVQVSPTGQLKVYGSGLVRATTAAVITPGQWYRLEFDATIANSGAYDLRLDGVSLTSGTNDFYLSGAADVATVFLDSLEAGYTVTIDDVIILDASGTTFNALLGDVKISTLNPTAEGSVSDFTPSAGADNALMVDDTPADDDSTYVESDTVNHEDLHAHEDLATTPASIAGVVVSIRAKDTGVGRGMKASARSGTTTGRSAEFPLAAAYKVYQAAFAVNPDTAAAWTASEVNGAEFGYQVSS